MDYKTIITSKKLRFSILRALSFVPDSIMIPIQYKMKTGRWPNLKHPTRFTEKLQVYKMKYRNPIMSRCVDKYEVRKYIEEQGFGKLLVPCLGIYNNASEIDFKSLPNQFVIKSTDGGGGSNVLICRDKSELDIQNTIQEINSWLGTNKVNPGREWAYTGIKKSRIIIEEYIPNDPAKGGLIDYKFFCFNAKCEYIYVVADRIPGKGGGLGIFTPDFIRLDVTRVDEHPLKRNISKPENYEELLATAERLAIGFPEVRVDLYNVDNKVLFGELTFYDGSGYMTFSPDSFDEEMGTKFDINSFT